MDLNDNHVEVIDENVEENELKNYVEDLVNRHGLNGGTSNDAWSSSYIPYSYDKIYIFKYDSSSYVLKITGERFYDKYENFVKFINLGYNYKKIDNCTKDDIIRYLNKLGHRKSFKGENLSSTVNFLMEKAQHLD